ncbi:hypothetical protein [endosymbiont of unidentified scaly snail isolate Monju]|uniref:hypothetical protein n=1 Tax=endosymbiont of unidentified scaly snail isolate Monju TaxID=1248727 RepID=UPI0011DDE8B8|nr:hypothetical protein [endosymbiont of unidentified scaly snail isolate Monju]
MEKHRRLIEQAAAQEATAPPGNAQASASVATREYQQQMRERFERFMAQRRARQEQARQQREQARARREAARRQREQQRRQPTWPPGYPPQHPPAWGYPPAPPTAARPGYWY